DLTEMGLPAKPVASFLDPESALPVPGPDVYGRMGGMLNAGIVVPVAHDAAPDVQGHLCHALSDGRVRLYENHALSDIEVFRLVSRERGRYIVFDHVRRSRRHLQQL